MSWSNGCSKAGDLKVTGFLFGRRSPHPQEILESWEMGNTQMLKSGLLVDAQEAELRAIAEFLIGFSMEMACEERIQPAWLSFVSIISQSPLL